MVEKDPPAPPEPPVETSSGIPLPAVFDRDDVPSDWNPERPGLPPFTRGATPGGYRKKPWTMRQYAGFSTAKASNERYRFLLAQGQTGLSVAFDLPTQIGFDSDHPLARGEVGKVGVAIDTLEDMEILLDSLPLERVSISMTINATASILLSLLLAVAKGRGTPWERLSGTIQNDILKEYAARGTYAFPPKPSMRLVTDVFAFCAKEVPRWNTISISGYHIREAGSTAVQEVAFTLADGLEYLTAAKAAGLSAEAIAPRLSFFFNVHNDFLEEIAKFRAARTLWARLVARRFGVTDPRALALRFHAQTAGSTLTAQQPDVNVVRVAIQALAAVLGGTQSLHTNGRDEALALPTEESALLALRTQQVIAFETGVARVADPFGGSFAVESLTAEIVKRAEALIERIDGMGGALAAIEAGFFQREIEESAYRAQRAIEESRQVVVGVNAFTRETEARIPTLSIDPSVETDQIARLAAFRSRRSAADVDARRRALVDAAREGRNLLPPMIDAVTSSVTLGEIVESLKVVFGEHRESSS
ncbi:MAG TPA: methylmalonyl-CoA mutase family protein [Thermoanaerobaculia bacterium]|nr:methylmalonyl-CoA mutase family protein [Thermoanaerobaculia bacterium]